MRRRLVVKYRLHRVSNSRAAALTQPESRAAAGLVKRTTREDVEAEPINKKPTTEKHGVLTHGPIRFKSHYKPDPRASSPPQVVL